MSRKWTHHDDNLFHQMWKSGMSYSEIAQRLNRTPGALDHRRKDLAFAPRPAAVVGTGIRAATRQHYRGLMEPNRGRKLMSKSDKPMGFTHSEMSQAYRDEQSCDMHLVDLLRAFGGGTIGEAKARYQAAHELNIPHERDSISTTYTAQQPASYCGSPAALCGGY